MPLWGANTANAADKPKWLNTEGDVNNVGSVIGVNASSVSNGAFAPGWVYVNPGDGPQIRFTIAAAGNNYTSGKRVVVSNIGGTNATGFIQTNPADGSIVAVNLGSIGTANATNIAGAVTNVTRQVANVTVGAQSVGYQNGWPVVFSAGFVTAAATIVTNATGGITGISFSERGEYINAPTANVGQALGNVTLGGGGTGYVNGAFLTVTGGGGSGANISITTNATGGITAFTYNSRGNAYTSLPSITAPTGTGATLTATVPGSNGTLTTALQGSGANITVAYGASNGRSRKEVLVAL